MPTRNYYRINILPPEIIKISGADYDLKLLDRPARILASGGVVIFPTETVYGLGVDSANQAAVNKFREIKSSPPDRPFTYHLADVDDVYRLVPNLGRLAKRVIRRFLPGPLTLVLPGGKDSWIGVRVPNNKIACDLIRLAGVRVIASSANMVDEPAPDSASRISPKVRDRADVIIDGGRTSLGISSTVLKIGLDDKWEILRQGSVTAEDIRMLEYKMVLFVCTGNTCRSPMAEGLFKRMAARKLNITPDELEKQGYKIGSAGTGAVYDMPASSVAIDVMREMGANIRMHRSQPLTLTLIEDADYIYVMTAGHLATIREWMPEAAGRTKLLDPDGEDIADPIGRDISVYRSCAFKIQKALERINL